MILKLLIIIVLFFLSACSTHTLLNSERIEQRYGSYGVEVLRADAGGRISNLYSESNGLRTMRTLAVVRFSQPQDPRLAPAQADILRGASIGATLKRSGWRVSKETQEICHAVPPGVGDYLAAMHLDGQPELAVHRYRLLVSDGGTPVEYATITEIHHPDYLSLQQLREIYIERPRDYVETDDYCVVRH